MPTTAAHDPSNALTLLLRVVGVAILAVGVALVIAFAAAAAMVIGLIVAGAAVALRFGPRPAPVMAEMLEARPTPAGWVVETRARHSS